MGLTSIYATIAPVWEKTGAQPALTWFSGGGERIELSAKVLDNWVIKTANMLFSEFDLSGGDTIGLHAPVHWRSMVFALATWQRGAQVQFLPEGPIPENASPDVLVSSQVSKLSSQHVNQTELVALHCASLSRQYPEDLPPLTLDANAATMTYPDQLLDFPDVEPDDPAVQDPALSHAEFLTRAARVLPAPASRVLVTRSDLQLFDALLVACRLWQEGSGLILLDPAFQWNTSTVEQISESEHAELFEAEQ